MAIVKKTTQQNQWFGFSVFINNSFVKGAIVNIQASTLEEAENKAEKLSSLMGDNVELRPIQQNNTIEL